MKPPAWAVRTASDRQAIAEGAIWDESKGKAIIDFAHAFFQPQYIKGEFRLLPWQRRFLMSVYCWRWPDGRRVKRFVSLHISKKSGKTLLVSLICLYELYCGEDPSSYVCAAAASKDNASQVFKELKHSIENSPFAKFTNIIAHQKKIEVPSINAEFRCFASQGSRVHGEPCSVVVLDEVAQHQNSDLLRALRFNTDARANGLVICISTAGADSSHFYHAIYQKSKRLIASEEVDVIWHAEVFEADPQSDYERDEKQWLRANPSLGVSFPVEQFRRDLLSAKQDLGEWLNFKRLKLGIWCRPDETAWLDVSDWERHKKDIPIERLLKCEASIGVDLSEVADPTSVSIAFDLGNRQYYVKSWCWVAEAGIAFRNKGTLQRFDDFVQAGHMQVSPGDMIDRNQVFQHIIDLCKLYDVKSVNFDPHGAYVLANDVENEGYTVARIVQSAKNYNPIMVEFARAYKEGRILHDGSSWLRYTLSNVRVDVNRYNEIRPYRKKSVDFIDGAISTLLAMNTAFQSLPPTERIFFG